jgi:hypothetical protein
MTFILSEQARSKCSLTHPLLLLELPSVRCGENDLHSRGQPLPHIRPFCVPGRDVLLELQMNVS